MCTNIQVFFVQDRVTTMFYIWYTILNNPITVWKKIKKNCERREKDNEKEKKICKKKKEKKEYGKEWQTWNILKKWPVSWFFNFVIQSQIFGWFVVFIKVF